MNVIAFITLIFLFIYQVTASDYHECDRLAGSPDSYENGIGMPMEKLNADIAIKACLDAIKQYPELSRFKTAIARAYTKEGDVDKAIEFYQLAIKKNANDKVALNNLASLLFKKDKISNALIVYKLLNQAAELGFTVAQFNLGVNILENPKIFNIENKYKIAENWLLKASDKDYTLAKSALGYFYSNFVSDEGKSFKNIEKAIFYLKDCAINSCFYDLALIYYDLKDYKNAKNNLLLITKDNAKTKNDILRYHDALFLLSNIHISGGSSVERNLTVAYNFADKLSKEDINYKKEIEKKKEDIILLYCMDLKTVKDESLEKIILNRDNKFEIGNLAARYHNLKKFEEGYKYTKIAAKKGHAISQILVGDYYKNGRGFYQNNKSKSEEDLKIAFEWYKKSADQNIAKAQWKLSYMLEKGEGVKKDISLAFKYLKMSANSDYAQAQAGLGFKYLFGNPELGIEVDYNLAKKWILLAAEKNNAWAYSMLSHIYRWGKGTNIDLDKALAYANLAVKNEYDKSINLDYLKKLVVNIKEDLKNEESFLEKSKNLENDKDPPIFKIINQKDNSSELVTLEGELEDKSNIAILLIDGTPIEISKNGFFKSELYVPKNGIEIRLEAIDQFGNKADKNIRLVRKEIIKKNSSKFSKLNPSKVNTSLNENDLALIIGITEYENIKPSIYARKDARFFYDYMQNILGVPSNRIKLLIGEEARRTDITLAYKNWVRGRINNQSNVYIFFSGNGLASADGKKLYLMPYDVYPSLLDDTAIGRDEIITSIQEVTPKSVYFFIDASYSGQTREKEMILTDARPITIVPIESDVPENFTVFSASSGSEISGSLPEADHGLFSYFLMKGLEGNADANNDKKITNGELHSYVRSNVTKQAVRLEREQTPQLQGDENRVLVEFY